MVSPERPAFWERVVTVYTPNLLRHATDSHTETKQKKKIGRSLHLQPGGNSLSSMDCLLGRDL